MFRGAVIEELVGGAINRETILHASTCGDIGPVTA
jgi:hypothetical protein